MKNQKSEEMAFISQYYYTNGIVPWGQIGQEYIVEWIDRFESAKNKAYEEREDEPLAKLFGKW